MHLPRQSCGYQALQEQENQQSHDPYAYIFPTGILEPASLYHAIQRIGGIRDELSKVSLTSLGAKIP
jgi:hypothetical protein